nr:nitronate monooxygenase [Microbacterium bovistercoris]
MTLPDRWTDRLTLPVVCAPMFLISNPAMVITACSAGLIGAFPRQNTRTTGEFESWLRTIRTALDARPADTRPAGPLAVNIPTTTERAQLDTDLDLCRQYDVDVIITSVGDPSALTRLAHDRGLLVHHDVTSIRFAEKAIAAGVDGLNCIGSGGGGHSGGISHLALIPRIRAMFDGTISLAGAVAHGAAIRAAEVLGADLAFIGSRFAATAESDANPRQKDWMIAGDSRALRYTNRVNGIPANWMLESLAQHGIDIDALPAPARRGSDHLPAGVAPWRDLWSAGQGIELIDDAPPIAEVIARLSRQYLAACEADDHAEAVRASLHPWDERITDGVS